MTVRGVGDVAVKRSRREHSSASIPSRFLLDRPMTTEAVSEVAIVHPTAIIGPSSTVDPGAVIGPDACIGRLPVLEQTR